MDLTGMQEFLESLPKEKIEQALKLYPRANQLKHYLECKGHIRIKENQRDIIIIDNVPGIKELKEIYIKIGVIDVKFIKADNEDEQCQN